MIMLNQWESGKKVVTLKEILAQITDYSSYNWYLFWLDAMGTWDCEFDYVALEEKINNSLDGILFPYDELLNLGNCLEQILSIKIRASPINTTNDHGEPYEICIELIDTSYWEIERENDQLLEKFRFVFASYIRD